MRNIVEGRKTIKKRPLLDRIFEFRFSEFIVVVLAPDAEPFATEGTGRRLMIICAPGPHTHN